jgi:hypothetical protein
LRLGRASGQSVSYVVVDDAKDSRRGRADYRVAARAWIGIFRVSTSADDSNPLSQGYVVMN